MKPRRAGLDPPAVPTMPRRAGLDPPLFRRHQDQELSRRDGASHLSLPVQGNLAQRKHTPPARPVQLQPFSRLREKVPGGRMRGERSELTLIFLCLAMATATASSRAFAPVRREPPFFAWATKPGAKKAHHGLRARCIATCSLSRLEYPSEHCASAE